MGRFYIIINININVTINTIITIIIDVVIIVILFKGLIILILTLHWIHIFDCLSCKTQSTEIFKLFLRALFTSQYDKKFI